MEKKRTCDSVNKWLSFMTMNVQFETYAKIVQRL